MVQYSRGLGAHAQGQANTKAAKETAAVNQSTTADVVVKNVTDPGFLTSLACGITGIFGGNCLGGSAAPGVPTATGGIYQPQEESGMGAWLLIGGLAIGGLVLLYVLRGDDDGPAYER